MFVCLCVCVFCRAWTLDLLLLLHLQTSNQSANQWLNPLQNRHLAPSSGLCRIIKSQCSSLHMSRPTSLISLVSSNYFPLLIFALPVPQVRNHISTSCQTQSDQSPVAVHCQCVARPPVPLSRSFPVSWLLFAFRCQTWDLKTIINVKARIHKVPRFLWKTIYFLSDVC